MAATPTSMFTVPQGTQVLTATEVAIQVAKITKADVCFTYKDVIIHVDENSDATRVEDAYGLYMQGYIQGPISATGKGKPKA